ncbi:unnamed protein product [Didymodactylos carnosus]|uniref:Uncharacterized protein n=1 Tax=Didymodactylos carnosus TaxID=1234261 RepID=A0A814SFK9_9BILA|nr:unnamed protein product [Didymodactylos carnosus]CAF1146771.1 unnamed protein product [Didymodactylos carnosus]CAF3807903.1 unnamed protein product [Didymodactylos carnosus]CAF3910306.1 unnamed protein product [Didymodactylos carnosus]
MAVESREVVLDVNDLPKTTTVRNQDDDASPKTTADPNQEDDAPPKQLPKPLAEFKQYVDSKLCYYSKPLENVELISIEPKIAYQCTMEILFETRYLRMVVKPYPWESGRVMGSRSLGKLNCLIFETLIN